MNEKPLPKIGIIACAVLEMELNHFSSGLEHVASLEIMKQDLHNQPELLRAELQAAIDRMEKLAEVEYIVLLFGLCSRAIEGLHGERCPLVAARAHDCITLLLGDKNRYASYAARFPGTYWYSPGWIATNTQPGKVRYESCYEEYLEKYGEDNADYLMELEQSWMHEYNRATYVDLGVGDREAGLAYTRECAQYLNWDVDCQEGEPSLLRDLLNCNWDEERFLIVRPGETFHITTDARVMEARKIKPETETCR